MNGGCYCRAAPQGGSHVGMYFLFENCMFHLLMHTLLSVLGFIMLCHRLIGVLIVCWRGCVAEQSTSGTLVFVHARVCVHTLLAHRHTRSDTGTGAHTTQ